jgi:hypothetical protein
MRSARVLKRSMRTLRNPFADCMLDEPLWPSSSPPRSSPVWTVLRTSTGGCPESPAASGSPRSCLALVLRGAPITVEYLPRSLRCHGYRYGSPTHSMTVARWVRYRSSCALGPTGRIVDRSRHRCRPWCASRMVTRRRRSLSASSQPHGTTAYAGSWDQGGESKRPAVRVPRIDHGVDRFFTAPQRREGAPVTLAGGGDRSEERRAVSDVASAGGVGSCWPGRWAVGRRHRAPA